MKKLISVLLAFSMIFSLSACGSGGNSAKDNSLIEIKGAFYGNCGAEDGYQDLYIVFDYKNDSQNRTMPTDSAAITAAIDDTNTYEADPNKEHPVTNKDYEYTTSAYHFFERYTGYRYVWGAGEILGGADPVRMFAHFTINPNDLKDGKTLKFAVEDQKAEIPVADMQEISVIDEILKVEDDFEKTQMIAATKWRLDSMYEIIMSSYKDALSLAMQNRSSSELKPMATAMKTLFSPESKGLSVNDSPSKGFNSSGTYNRIVEGLPAYDEQVFLSAYPEVKDKWNDLMNQWNEYIDLLTRSGIDTKAFGAAAQGLMCAYDEVLSAIDLELFCTPKTTLY